MFGMIIMYIAIGMITCGLVMFIHIVSAQIQGYLAFEYWEVALHEFDSNLTPLKFVWGMIIWPIILYKIIALVPMFYDVYDWRKYGPRTRKGWL